MHVMLCLDDRNGMLFNRRRQSRDREALRDMLETAGPARLWVAPMSAGLFPEGAVCVDESPLDAAAPGDYCLMEQPPLGPWAGRIESLTVYRWNRLYPSDAALDLDLGRWRLVSRRDFPGHSHETLTKEVYLP